MTGTPARPAAIDRLLGATENIDCPFDQLHCLNFAVFAELDGRFDAGRLAAALAIVQAENPSLRARIANPRTRCRLWSVRQASTPMRPEVLLLAGWRRALERQLQRPFDVGQAWLRRA